MDLNAYPRRTGQMAEAVERKPREFPPPTTGHGPGPYLFGGEQGLEKALDAVEQGINWLELFETSKVVL